MALSKPLKSGSREPEVAQVQAWLIELGFSLPRFGVDGVLGDETLLAYGAFLVSRGQRAPGDVAPSTITPTGYAAIAAAAGALADVPTPGSYFDERPNHPHAGRSVATPFRTWAKTSAIVLHQTASLLGEKPQRWRSVPIHIGVTRAGKIVHLYDFTEICNHANSLNTRSIGIEIDGWYAGIEGKPETLWQPPGGGAPRKPMDLPAAQRDAVRSAIQWILSVVAKSGGQITHIHAHRQSSGDRRSDPGSLIWQEVGIWAQSTLGLSDGGGQFNLGSGRRIPREWDARYPGNLY